MQISADMIEQFAKIVGAKNAITDGTQLQAHTNEPRGRYGAPTSLVLKPNTTQQVSEIVSLAAAHNIKIVPQGGNTGLVGGQMPTPNGNEIIVSMSRLNQVREVDIAAGTMTVDAGCILEDIQNTAAAQDRFFPLRIGSQGSCQIGGNISSNAGGTGVLAYGNMRELVMGLEVVLADGRIWNGLNKLKKNNTGYDLKHLFIGGEGTLGIITGATLKLFPSPRGSAMALIGLNHPNAALKTLSHFQQCAGADLTAFELIDDTVWGLLLNHFGSKHRHPLSARHNWYCLIEISSHKDDAQAEQQLSQALETAFEQGFFQDAAVAISLSQQKEFWRMRENLSWAQVEEGACIKHDISLPISALPQFIELAAVEISQIEKNARIVCFGHMGDGNLHYNIMQPANWTPKEFFSLEPKINEAVYALVAQLSGSISAEHGIGQVKRKRLAALKDAPELEMMKAIKQALDPQGLFNPKKLI